MTLPGIDGRHERLHEPGPEPLWAESLMSYTVSPRSGVATWIHLARLPLEPTLWESIVVVALAGDEWVVARSVLPATSDEPLETGGVRWSVEEPYRELTVAFRGGGRRVTGEALRSAPVTDGPIVPIDLRYTSTAVSPPYDFGGAIGEQSWASGHVELSETMAGRLSCGATEMTLEGIAWRDHSWGPRDFTGFGHHTFVNAVFPESGRSVTAVTLHPPAGAETRRLAVVTSPTDVAPVATFHVPPAADLAARGEHVLAFDEATIAARIERQLPLAFLGTSQIGIGTFSDQGAHTVWLPHFTRFVWGGEVGHGSIEWSRRRTQHASS